MNNFKIVTDSSHDLGEDFLLDHGIQVVPFYLRLGDDKFLKDFVDIRREELYSFMRENPSIFPSTSLPSLEDFAEKFRRVLEEGSDVLCFTVSSGLSGTYQSAKLASDLVLEEFPDRRILLIDSKSGSLGLGILIERALDLKREGRSLDQVKEVLEKMAADSQVYILLDSLSYLLHGGRISRTKAMAGSLLRIKPVIRLEEGSLELAKALRGSKRALDFALELLDRKIGSRPDDYHVFVVHGDARDLAYKVRQEIEERYGIVIKHDPPLISATISCHIGPGSLGIGCIRKY